MKICDLIRLDEAPVAGNLLAYTRKKVIFREYKNLAEVRAILADQELLEVHLFDPEKEYRCILTRSPRYERGVIETVADFPEQTDRMNIYTEQVLLEDSVGGGSITVLNHLKYHEKSGMMTVDNYRLKMGEN